MVLRDLLSCTFVQPSTVVIFQVLQSVCVWPIILNVVVGQKPHICVWTLRYFQVCMDNVVTKDWQTRETGKVLACVHPGAWKTSTAQTLEATKHRSQTDWRAP